MWRADNSQDFGTYREAGTQISRARPLRAVDAIAHFGQAGVEWAELRQAPVAIMLKVSALDFGIRRRGEDKRPLPGILRHDR